MDTAQGSLKRLFEEGAIGFEARMREINRFMSAPGTFAHVVPEGDGCWDLPSGSILHVSPCSGFPEGLHVLENIKTGHRMARWLNLSNGAGMLTAAKRDKGEPVDKMVIDLSAQELEWVSMGQVRYMFVYLDGSTTSATLTSTEDSGPIGPA